MSESIKKVAAFLAGLSPAERSELQTQLAYAATRETDVVRNNVDSFSDNEQFLWDVLQEAVGRQGVRDLGPAENHIKAMTGSKHGNERLGRSKFCAMADAFAAFIDEGCGIRLSAVHRRAIAVRLMIVLADWVKMVHRQAATPAGIEKHFDRLRAVTDRAYPGYVEARLLHMIAPRASDHGRFPVMDAA